MAVEVAGAIAAEEEIMIPITIIISAQVEGATAVYHTPSGKKMGRCTMNVTFATKLSDNYQISRFAKHLTHCYCFEILMTVFALEF